MRMRQQVAWKTLCLVLLTCGLAVSAYLLYRHAALLGDSAAGADFCNGLFGTGCDETLRSRWAVQLGLPLAGWGLVYYGTLAVLLALGWTVGEAFEFEATVGALALGLVAAAMSIVLMGVMFAGLAPFCPLCAVVHVVNLLLLLPLKRLTGRSVLQLSQVVAAGGRYLLGRQARHPQTARWRIVGFFATALFAVVIYQWVYVEHGARVRSTQTAIDADELLQTLDLYETALRHDISCGDDDAQIGPSQAPIRLVVFSDFQCPACTSFARTLSRLRRRFEDKLHIVFKHFPLSSDCNAMIKANLHPRACEWAYAAEAARRQDKFWPFHDAMFSSSLGEDDTALVALTEKIGIDLERFDTDRRLQGVQEKVQSDVDLGIRLGIDGTPAVFVSGRRIYDIRLQALEYIVSHELEHHDPQNEALSTSSSRSH